MKNLKIFFLISTFLFSAVTPVFAAEINFSSSYREYNKEDTFRVDLNLDTQGESINACDMEINFNPAVLETLELSMGDSVLSLWVQEPLYSNQSGQIYLSGGIPGGFNGKGKIISIIFRAIGSGLTGISVKNGSKILLNDGIGSEVEINIKNADINILPVEKTVQINEWKQDIKRDEIPPERFKIKTGKDQTVFGGKYFIVFSTVDAGTGISHYEIKEGDSEWKTGNSPYVLENQDLNGTVWVKAVDFAGNERIEELSLSKKNYFSYTISFVAATILLLGLILFIKKKRKRHEK